MKLIDPSVSRAMATLMKTLTPKERSTLSGLTLKFINLDELPGKWQMAIEEEMAKNAVINQQQNEKRKSAQAAELLHGEKDIDTVSSKALDLSQIRIEWIEE
jgi:uncharacterized protein YbcC (UPF0753/DUF2309 family)